MATIALQPGEIFEHYHCAPSETIHVCGDVEFRVDGKSRRMHESESIWVPANARHSVKNVGESIAQITCVGTGPAKHHSG